jgi:hypothetical protein
MHLSTTILLLTIFGVGGDAAECHGYRYCLTFGQRDDSKQCCTHDCSHHCQSQKSTAWVHASFLPITEGRSHGVVPLACKVKASHLGLKSFRPSCANVRRYRNHLYRPMASSLSPLPIPKVRLGDSNLWVPEIGFSASSWGDPRQGYGYEYTDPMLEQVNSTLVAMYTKGRRTSPQLASRPHRHTAS